MGVFSVPLPQVQEGAHGSPLSLALFYWQRNVLPNWERKACVDKWKVTLIPTLKAGAVIFFLFSFVHSFISSSFPSPPVYRCVHTNTHAFRERLIIECMAFTFGSV